MYQRYGTLLVERQGRILNVTLNRPHVRNAANAEMQAELSRIFFEIARDPDAHVVVITGAGDAFSAGGDIGTMLEKLEDPAIWNRTVEEARGIVQGLLELDRPVIAKVRGPAVGLGATLALLSDIVVCSDSARIGDPHVKVGLVAGDGGALIWPLLVGPHRAKEYLLTGDLVDAAEAERIGLVNRVVPDADLDREVFELADRMANGATLAVRGTKRAINLWLRQLADATIEAHFGLETLTHFSRDRREAAVAFTERRPAVFTGE